MRFRALLIAAVLLSACGGDDEAASTMSKSKAVDEVVVGGIAYEVTCAEPEATKIGAEVEVADVDARFDGAAEVVGEDAAAVLALRADGRIERCPAAAWVLGFARLAVVDEATATEAARLHCAVPARPDDPRCAEGGPFWFGTDLSVDGTEGDGRSAVWVDGRVPPPGWRLDPVEVVAREVAEDGAVPSYYRLERVGLRVLEDGPDEAVIEVIYQDVFDTAGKLRGSDQRERYTLGRLPGRQGWYPTTFLVTQYSDDDVDDAALDAAWAAGVDRVLVDVDRR